MALWPEKHVTWLYMASENDVYCRQKATFSTESSFDDFLVIFGVELDCGNLRRNRLP